MGRSVPRRTHLVSIARVFPDYEDARVRGDRNEGTAQHRTPGGLSGYNHTQGMPWALPHHAFTSSANPGEIFVFCASRSLTDKLRVEFEATVYVEIPAIPEFCR
jgi:hypothetical protein